ncbi:unnamed protein product, partial [Mesorhabditis spiculigera]
MPSVPYQPAVGGGYAFVPQVGGYATGPFPGQYSGPAQGAQQVGGEQASAGYSQGGNAPVADQSVNLAPAGQETEDMENGELPKNLDKFPKDFIWAIATADFQVEGSNDVDGRGVSVWDRIREMPGRIKGDPHPNLSCEAYKKWKEDVELLKALGVSHYRFSISWSRILPTGRADQVNEAGIRYYRELCEELVKHGIKPIVTLFHYDMPLPLYEEGGFLNPDSIDWFTEFAEVCFKHFGDLVDVWLTFNEIIFYAMFSVVPMEHLPDFSLNTDHGRWNLTAHQVPYLVAHHKLLAHARVYRLYREKFYEEQKGLVGIISGGRFSEPISAGPEDVTATKMFQNWHFFWINDPIFGSGDYPPAMRQRLDAMAVEEGLSTILPKFTDEEKRLLKEIVKERYSDVPVLLTENGCADMMPASAFADPLQDYHRVKYIREHVAEVGQAIEKGSSVIGYTAWSLLDNFEWLDGFEMKFGLFRVDFESPEKTRTPKASAKYYQKLVSTARGLDPKNEL